MKNISKALFTLSLFGLALTGCNKEPGNGPDNTETGDKSRVTLTIKNGVIATRGATGEGTASEAESKVDHTKGIKVYVFNEDGSLDYASPAAANLALTPVGGSSDVYESASFAVNAGKKYFFVFVNDPASGGKVNAPTASMNMNDFMTQAINVVRDASTDVPNIAVNENFLLGTLWAETEVAPAGGDEDEPATVALSIGRLISKVNLASVVNTTNNVSLKGTFEDATYRIGTLPMNIHTAGVHVGDKAPLIGNNGVLVKSYVHGNEPLDKDAVTPTDFYRYSKNFVAADVPFYTTENTNGGDANGVQYFGNVTYIQIETVYTPGDEVYDPEDLSQTTTFSGTTFYTARLNSTKERLIFASNPHDAAAPDADIDMDSVLEYVDGKNYHKFPVYDKNETSSVLRNRVLRNHLYEYKLTNFKDLGSPESEVDPWEPVPDKTTVDLEVTVKPWDKVIDDNVEV